MKVDLYNDKGIKKAESFALPKGIAEEGDIRLLAQALHVYRSRRHFGLSKTKTRSEIDLTKKKVYRQKGTGNARHGAKSAPIFVGGSKAHGPKGLKRKLTITKNMGKKALKVSMSMKAKEERLVLVENMDKVDKTKTASLLLSKISEKVPFSKNGQRFTVVLSKDNYKNEKAFRNIQNTKIARFNELNAYDVYFGGIVVLDKGVFEVKKSIKKEIKSDKKINTKKS